MLPFSSLTGRAAPGSMAAGLNDNPLARAPMFFGDGATTPAAVTGTSSSVGAASLLLRA